MEVKTLFNFDTTLHADCVEFCPYKDLRHYLVCASYQLIQPETKDTSAHKVGRIVLCRISKEKGFEVVQSLDLSAILDVKWNPTKPFLAAATSVGEIIVYSFGEDMLKLAKKLVVSPGNLLLSLEWGGEASQAIVTSDNQGQVHVIDFLDEEIKVKSSWKLHDFEAWTCNFLNENEFFSGADDCALVRFDLRLEKEVFRDKKTHGAGVTSVQFDRRQNNVLATASYDEFVRLWDVRKMKGPVSQIKMPGPVWRLKWKLGRILAACMLNGAHIIEAEDLGSLKIVCSYGEHDNIVYGCDWSSLNLQEKQEFDKNCQEIVATCSFYDHLLCLWAI